MRYCPKCQKMVSAYEDLLGPSCPSCGDHLRDGVSEFEEESDDEETEEV